MSSFTVESTRRLARYLCVHCSKESRNKIVECLDTEFKLAVLEEIAALREDMPLEMRDTSPAPPIPFIGHHDNG
jgi:hypothetical protein